MMSSEVTLPILWQQLAERYGDRLALHDPHSKPAVRLTYQQLYQQAADFASGLQALGVSSGQRVAIVAENSPLWLISDMGTMMAGAANAPRSSVADARELAYIVRHSRSRTLIVEDAKTLAKLQPELADYPLDTIILMSDEPAEGCMSLREVQARGQTHSFSPPPT